MRPAEDGDLVVSIFLVARFLQIAVINEPPEMDMEVKC